MPLPVAVTLTVIIGLSCGGDDTDVGTGPVSVATVEISPAEGTIITGETVQLSATPKDANGATLTDRSVAWSSSDAAVATVSDAGLVTGVAAGDAMITAASEGKSGSAAITVAGAVALVEVTPASATVLNGESLQLTATAKDAAGNPLTDRPVTWSSDAAAVVAVTPSGSVTGVESGTATITAAAEGQSGTAVITVTVLDVGGRWTFTENISDPVLGLSCVNEGTFAFTQEGATFTGTNRQRGDCTFQGQPVDNSGTFQITQGSIQRAIIEFTEPGDVVCVYRGDLADNPPTGASGTVSCNGFIDLFIPVHATGTWEMTR
jgi:hypothetical protein